MIRRGLGLGLVAVAAGLMLQCMSSTPLGTDGGIARNGDGSRHAEAAGPDASGGKSWFKMSYARNGGAQDSLLVEGSAFNVALGWAFSEGKLVPMVASLVFLAHDPAIQASVQVSLSPRVIATGPVDVSTMKAWSLAEMDATPAGGQILLAVTRDIPGASAAGTLTITKLGRDLIAGSFQVTIKDGKGQQRDASGSFEYLPCETSSCPHPGHLMP